MSKTDPSSLSAPAQPGRPDILPSPLLLDFSLTVSRLVVLGVGLATGLLSALAGATLWAVALRTGLAILGLGLLLWGLNTLVNHNALEIVHHAAEGTHPAVEQPLSTIEKHA